MKTELILKFSFVASHSLAGYETPHPHYWNLEIAFEGRPIQGRIVDMIALRNRIQLLLQPLSSTYLNESPDVDAQVREFPTCETLSFFLGNELNEMLKKEFQPENPSVRLSSIGVAICDMEKIEMGAVRLSFPPI